MKSDGGEERGKIEGGWLSLRSSNRRGGKNPLKKQKQQRRRGKKEGRNKVPVPCYRKGSLVPGGKIRRYMGKKVWKGESETN